MKFSRIVLLVLGVPCTVLAPAVAHGADPYATDVAAGDYHSCMVTSCGAVECWGRNDWGQANNRTAPGPFAFIGHEPYESVSVGQYHTCALDEVGKIHCWGKANYGQTTEPTGTFEQIDSGANHNCGIDTGGNVECWGADDQGQVSDAPGGTFSQVSAGRLHSCAVTDPPAGQEPEIICWGADHYGQSHDYLPIESADLWWGPVVGEQWDHVEAGAYHTCATSNFGYTYCWGYAGSGATGATLGTLPTTDPTIQYWSGRRSLSISAGRSGNCVEFLPDGDSTNPTELLCWGWPFDTLYSPPSVSPKAVAVGSNHACYIADDDIVECFGSSAYDKLDVPDINACPGLPTPIPWPWPAW